MKMQFVRQHWHELTNTNRLYLFIDAILRSYGQVMLQNNPLSGLIFLVGVILGGYSAGKPQIGLACLLAVISANAAAYLYQLNRKAWQQGIYGFNACLIGIALTTFCENSLYLWCSIVLAAILSVFITQAFNTILQQWCLPCLTIPFVLTTWLFLLAAPSLSALTLYPPLATSEAQISGYNLLHLVPDSILGIAEVFLFNSTLAGIIFLTGLAINSLRIAIYALAGSVLAIGVAVLYGGQIAIISQGLYSFNAILTAITLATFSSNQDVKTSLYIVFGIILTVFTQAALATLFKPFAIPVLTMPFILVSWLWLLFNQTLNQR
ncbi:urea transporter [Snodgrassella sp. ESL0253]|uniref:urea transporter n=1 Tax=Snodgrassella sp. ESL0253 TaxID=2705031 RepID=UPI0015832183|nr:urea transporter [Snodgrassella sp. ESL0253]NUE66299.1 urea transporter [Snodgrassella sp. ESL0253]